jgi:hypothetical protein
VKVFTVRSLSDIRRSGIFRGNVRNYHGCAMRVRVRVAAPLVYLPKNISYNDSGYRNVYEDGYEIELLRIIGNSINVSLDIVEHVQEKTDDLDTDTENSGSIPFVSLGSYVGVSSDFDNSNEYTRSYLNIRTAWYTPCALKYQRWSRFFNILSVDRWICFALSLVLAVITVRCISNYGHKSHLYESNIFSVTSNTIAVSLSVSVSTQPRSAPLRLFFFCWVCYSVAISTVFQAYLTTFLLEPGYEKPLKNVDEMLKSGKKFGFNWGYASLFNHTPDVIESAVLRDALQLPDEVTCFIWATVYHNMSTVLHELEMENYRGRRNWTDENNRPLLCELEDGVVRSLDAAISGRKGSPFIPIIDDILGHIIEGGIFLHILKRNFEKEKIESRYHTHTFADTYYAISINHLRTAFYFLMLGYVLAVVGFVTEIMWYRYMSKVL